MDEKIEGILLSVISAILIILSFFLLSLTKITISDFLTINVFKLIEKAISLEFLLFLIILSLVIAIFIKISKQFEVKESLLFILPSYVFSTIIGLFVFNLLEFLLVFLFSTIGIVLIILTGNKDTGFGPGIKAAKKFDIFFAIGIFVAILLITLPNATQYEEDFASDLLTSTIGNEDSLNDTLMSSFIKPNIETQIATLQTIKNLPSYKTLENKDDIDVQTFITTLNATENFFKTEEYKNIIRTELSKQNFFVSLIDSFPIIKNVAQYAWFIYPFLAFVLLVSICSLIIQNLIAFFYFILEKISQKAESI